MENKKLKIAIASGKGGVGKSMLTSALAMLFVQDKKKIIAVDCDVDAPNLAVWLGDPEHWKKVKKISVSEKPVINNNIKLSKKEAQQCSEKCRFNALEVRKGKLKLNPFLCEGCGACEIFCPKGVIKMKPVKNGEIKLKKIYFVKISKSGTANQQFDRARYSFPLISGQLFPGETGSGKVVSELKAQAEKFDGNTMLIDSAPGTGCPVIASLQDSDFAVLITEPTPSGFSDLNRVLEVVEHFKLNWGLVINKWDINKSLTKRMEKKFKNNLIGRISYDKNIFKAIANLTPILKTDLRVKKEIENIYNKLKKYINSN